MYILTILQGLGFIQTSYRTWQEAHYYAQKAVNEYGSENVTLRRV